MKSNLVVFFFASIVNFSAFAQTAPVGSMAGALAGTAVTCTGSTVDGDVGVWPGTAVTQTSCSITGTVHHGDGVAKQAYTNFIAEWDRLSILNTCDAAHTLTGTLAGLTLNAGVYCVDATAKTGQLTLDAQGNAAATWLFLVSGALTGTSFNVVAVNDGDPCNVTWWASAASTMTTSNFVGNILAGAAITVTGGTVMGNLSATAAITLTGTIVNSCPAAPTGCLE